MFSIKVVMSEKLPDISTEFAEWYQEIVYQAELADHGFPQKESG